MKAVICTRPFDMIIGQTDKPSPGRGEVLVRVAAAGICAGDQYIYTGKNPYVIYPNIGGHEIAGTVAVTCEGDHRFTKGQKVVIEPFIACGRCYACRIGKSNCCVNLTIIGVHRPGGFADYVLVPVENIFPLPDDLPLWKACLAEPVTIAIHACERSELDRNDIMLVMGCGPIGMNVIEVARERGAHVIATDVNEQRLEVAAVLGAETLLADGSLEEKVLAITNGEGMPVVIEASGVPTVMEQAIRLVAAGGRVTMIGLIKKGKAISFEGLDLTRKELTIHGSRNEKGAFPEAIRLLHSGCLKFPEMATLNKMDMAPEIFAQLAEKPDTYFKSILVNE
ncbi:MAG TPA: alcohol dehydrogenase catalytic domain-containing protein [Puia sp.]